MFLEVMDGKVVQKFLTRMRGVQLPELTQHRTPTLLLLC